MTNVLVKIRKDKKKISALHINSVLSEPMFGSRMGYVLTQRRVIVKEVFILRDLLFGLKLYNKPDSG